MFSANLTKQVKNQLDSVYESVHFLEKFGQVNQGKMALGRVSTFLEDTGKLSLVEEQTEERFKKYLLEDVGGKKSLDELRKEFLQIRADIVAEVLDGKHGEISKDTKDFDLVRQYT